MASTQVDVKVVDGPSTVDDSIRRPVRLTPDGYAGVVYAGSVYPLTSGNKIDLAGASWEVEDCNRFLFAGAPIPYAPDMDGGEPTASAFRGEWNIESNRYGHYVVFNAPERAAAAVVDMLEAGGLSVQRWDVSHRPASDGRFYDWFARLRFKGRHEEVLARVSEILADEDSEAPQHAIPLAGPNRVEDLEAQIERLVDEVVDLRHLLEASATEVTGLRRSLDGSRARESQLTVDLARSLEDQRALQRQVGQLSRSDAKSPEATALLAKQADTEELLELALAENAELRNDLAAARVQAEHGDARILTLEASVLGLEGRLEELGELERERRRLAETRRAPRRGVSGFLDTAFSRLAFVLDSVEVLSNLEAPAAVLRCLVKIDEGEVIGKDLEGLRGWREISKLSTGIAGSEDMGRIYYKPDGDRVLVSVHVKHDDKEQRRHISRLRAV